MKNRHFGENHARALMGGTPLKQGVGRGGTQDPVFGLFLLFLNTLYNFNTTLCYNNNINLYL